MNEAHLGINPSHNHFLATTNTTMSVDPFQPILLHPDDDLSPAVVLEVSAVDLPTVQVDSLTKSTFLIIKLGIALWPHLEPTLDQRKWQDPRCPYWTQ